MTQVIDPTAAYGRPGWEPTGAEMPSDLDGPKLLLGTRKGAWILAGDQARKAWAMAGPMFLGHIIQHVVQDPRPDGQLLAACRTGHLGPTVGWSRTRTATSEPGGSIGWTSTGVTASPSPSTIRSQAWATASGPSRSMANPAAAVLAVGARPVALSTTG